MSQTPSRTVEGEPSRQGLPLRKILPGFLLPLFFLIGLPLGLVSAFHAPAPHDLSLSIVGPSQLVGKITTKLDKTAEFSATQTDDTSTARSSVKNRDVVGAIEITPHQAPARSASTSSGTPASEAQPTTTFTVTTYVAGAGGRSAAAAVEATAATIAQQLGTTSQVVDVAPLSKDDTLGTTLFYILTYTSLGGYLVIIVLTQVLPKARLRTRFAAITGAAIVLPLLVFGLSSIFVGDYDASFGTIMALLGVDAISVFTVGSVAILMQSILGNAAIFGVMGTVVFLNFPSAGGAVPGSMLPPFWQAIHNVWFGAGAYESFRSIVYFDGAGLGRWLPQLLAWTVGLLLLIFIVHLSKKLRAQTHELEELRAAPSPQHLDFDPIAHNAALPSTQQTSLTTGTEAAR